jgi:predicted nucleotidyltransferase
VGSIREAFVFGSTARRTDRDDSDLDVGIVGLIDLRDLVRHQGRLADPILP